MPKVTILVCTYNKEETIEKCLVSILDNGYESKEIIVVDGFSTDNTFKILIKYSSKIKLLRKKGGYSAQLNFGVQEAKGEFIAFTDADCTVDKKWIENLLSGFTSQGIIATAGFFGTAPSLSLLQTIVGLELESRINRYPQFLVRAPTANLMVKKSIAKQVEFNEQIKVSVEQDFCYRLARYGKIKYVPAAKVWHYHRSSLKPYFHQQANYTKGAFWVYLKNKRRLKGDNVTGFSLIIQIPIFIGIFASLFLSFFFRGLVFFSILLTASLFLVYFRELVLIKPRVRFFLPMLFLFLFRNVAWSYGLFQNIIPFMIRREAKFKI